METNNIEQKPKGFKTNALPFIIIAGTLIVATVVLYYILKIFIS